MIHFVIGVTCADLKHVFTMVELSSALRGMRRGSNICFCYDGLKTESANGHALIVALMKSVFARGLYAKYWTVREFNHIRKKNACCSVLI